MNSSRITSSVKNLVRRPVIWLAAVVILAIVSQVPRARATVTPGVFKFTAIKQMTNGSTQVNYKYSGESLPVPYRLWAIPRATAVRASGTWTLLLSTNMVYPTDSYTDTDATNHPVRIYIITAP